MSNSTSRRDFLKQGTLAGAGVWLGTQEAFARSRSANERLNVGIIGAGGRGAANMGGVAATENIAALCDIDEGHLAKAAEAHPQAVKFVDFRKLLERKDIDAVVISTPDHTHATAASMALRLGKHVYCEKPLTHSVQEARVLTQLARETGLATQMGNQGHSNNATRRTVELIRSGVIGQIQEVHTWTDRPIWPQGINRPADNPPTPAHVHWDLWLGPAPQRAYHSAYHPFSWRGWWDFGTGALGDMACHVMDIAYWALELTDPLIIRAEGPEPHADSAPPWSIVSYQFPRSGQRAPVSVIWYDGKKLPPAHLFHGEKIADNGSLFVGEKGKIYVADPYGSSFQLLPKAQFEGFVPPAPYLPDSPGHYAEWVQACKGGKPAGSNFLYSGPFTEMVLLGNVAYRAGQSVGWNSRRMHATNCPKAAELVQREYRRGWTL
jgi:predicted dehydrogenase